ncbi:brix domain-containing protein [Heterostelium album PN500]|uniref:Brix domain-containing protein n=1 Tax=Heterostelium pallidum (strain ATCC 26659 / Pp 5 / PN500) TaxID=670386 RepID=D3BJY4_HETP5|nr:brix domain-containing protein [Heterostelium album PN500]EFA78214.1 brix domain-containing protein [Heterostelium album PN500]|eukprot:XP_020430340.1 brix domain-containing protein [Heterostelium album PN500]
MKESIKRKIAEEDSKREKNENNNKSVKKQKNENNKSTSRVAAATTPQVKEDDSIFIKKRVLVMSTRGISPKNRHLMGDLLDLIPHSKKESKLDDRKSLSLINESCEMKSCNYAILFDSRKHTDLYLWMAKTPLGPTIKFGVSNVHTLEELQMTGNCLKGSRPFLHFDATFDGQPHLQLAKELLTQIFSTPKGHVKSKPFFDHVFAFFYQDGRIWFRNYQISDHEFKKQERLLTEIGPRMILHISKIFSGGFGGQVLYSNPEFVSPNDNRMNQKTLKANKYVKKIQSRKVSEERHNSAFIEPSEVERLFDEDYHGLEQ